MLVGMMENSFELLAVIAAQRADRTREAVNPLQRRRPRLRRLVRRR